MTDQEIREHIANRERTPGGMIARIEAENLAGVPGEEHRDINPIALAFITAAHEPSCDCTHCAVCR